MILASGTRLGVYEIVAPIGKGGFGEVYRARDTRLDRSVAIKVLPSADPELKARFDREARTIASLQHPHVCALFDLGHDHGLDYLVLELLEGETLAARIQRGALPLEEALTIGRAIASALDRAHAAGIVHRDLKPENVMLTRSGPKLLDFGLAKLRRSPGVFIGASMAATAEVPRVTAEGTIVGTLHYMSPEQIEGRDADARSDIWAFGCMLYEMLTAQKAFDGTSPASLIAAIIGGAAPRVSARQPLTPPAIDRVVATCLASAPDERFHSAHDLGLQLQWIAVDPAATMPAGSSPRLRYLPWMVSAAALIAATVLALRSPAPPAAPDQAPLSFRIDAGPEDAPFPTAPMFLTVAPDGGSLAFVSGELDASTRLAIRSLSSTDARWLPGTDNVDQPFWSPDSRSIAFVDQLEAKLKRVDVAGGPPRTIADLPGGRTLQGGTWNQNGDILMGVIGGGNPLYRVPASGGTPVPATTLDRAAGELGHFWPHFLPDGDHFLYTVPNVTPDRSGIFISSLRSGGSTRLVDTLSNSVYSDPGFLLFVRDETLMAQRFNAGSQTLADEPFVVANGMGTGAGNGRAAFAASRNGVLAYRPQSGGVYATSLAWIDRAGNILSRVGTSNLHRAIALSPDNRRIAAQIGWTVGSDIWVADERGVFTRVTSDPSNEEFPVWSPDGSRIAFGANRNGAVFNVYDMPADGRCNGRAVGGCWWTRTASWPGASAEKRRRWRSAPRRILPSSRVCHRTRSGSPTRLTKPGKSRSSSSGFRRVWTPADFEHRRHPTALAQRWTRALLLGSRQHALRRARDARRDGSHRPRHAALSRASDNGAAGNHAVRWYRARKRRDTLPGESFVRGAVADAANHGQRQLAADAAALKPRG